MANSTQGGSLSAVNINRVVLLGNLTRDPELRTLPSGANVCRLRVASNTRRRNPDSGDWDEKPNFFDVSVFGASGEACGTFLEKGRPVAVDGRLEWHEWETADGQRRQSVEIIADSVQFLGGSRPVGETREPAAEDSAAAEKDDEALVF
jgi:single-strand DNA-binding protein